MDILRASRVRRRDGGRVLSYARPRAATPERCGHDGHTLAPGRCVHETHSLAARASRAEGITTVSNPSAPAHRGTVRTRKNAQARARRTKPKMDRLEE